MPAFPIGKNNRTRAQGANTPCQCDLVVHAKLKMRVRETEVFAKRNAENARGSGRLTAPQFDGTSRTHLSLGQIENSDAIAAASHLDDGAAAGQLHIVGMSGDRQYIEFH